MFKVKYFVSLGALSFVMSATPLLAMEQDERDALLQSTQAIKLLLEKVEGLEKAVNSKVVEKKEYVDFSQAIELNSKNYKQEVNNTVQYHKNGVHVASTKEGYQLSSQPLQAEAGVPVRVGYKLNVNAGSMGLGLLDLQTGKFLTQKNHKAGEPIIGALELSEGTNGQPFALMFYNTDYANGSNFVIKSVTLHKALPASQALKLQEAEEKKKFTNTNLVNLQPANLVDGGAGASVTHTVKGIDVIAGNGGYQLGTQKIAMLPHVPVDFKYSLKVYKGTVGVGVLNANGQWVDELNVQHEDDVNNGSIVLPKGTTESHLQLMFHRVDNNPCSFRITNLALLSKK